MFSGSQSFLFSIENTAAAARLRFTIYISTIHDGERFIIKKKKIVIAPCRALATRAQVERGRT